MAAAILGILAGVVSLLVWWVNRAPARAAAKRLAEKRALEAQYAEAVAAGDTVGMAAVQRRMQQLEGEDAAGAGK